MDKKQKLKELKKKLKGVIEDLDQLIKEEKSFNATDDEGTEGEGDDGDGSNPPGGPGTPP